MIRRHQLAIAAVCEIAATGKRLSQVEISRRLKTTSRRHLEVDLQALVKAGILRASRGPSGGYEFVRSPTTFDDVLRAVDHDYTALRELPIEDEVQSRIHDAMRRITVTVRGT